jgi:hypothetical protein
MLSRLAPSTPQVTPQRRIAPTATRKSPSPNDIFADLLSGGLVAVMRAHMPGAAIHPFVQGVRKPGSTTTSPMWRAPPVSVPVAVIVTDEAPGGVRSLAGPVDDRAHGPFLSAGRRTRAFAHHLQVPDHLNEAVGRGPPPAR